MEKTVVCGVGNPYVKDDGIGVFVVRDLNNRIRDARVVCTEITTGAFDILATIAGYNQAILIDAVRTGNDPPGSLKRLALDVSLTPSQPRSIHSVNLLNALRLGPMLGVPMPRCLDIFTIEGKDAGTFCEGCSDEIQVALPRIVREILRFIDRRIPDLCLAPDDCEPFAPPKV